MFVEKQVLVASLLGPVALGYWNVGPSVALKHHLILTLPYYGNNKLLFSLLSISVSCSTSSSYMLCSTPSTLKS
ncbi:hypothetical protein S83_009083 [Arachis hypogaea]